MSFRLKTVLGIALIEAALLLVLILVSLNYLRVSNEQQFLTRAETTAQLFATTAKDAVLVTDVALLDTLVEEVLTNPGVVYARVLGHERVLAEGGDAPPPAPARPPKRSIGEARHGVFDVQVELAAEGETYGRVELGLTVAPIQAVLRDARNHALSIAGVEMVLVAFFSLVLGTYLTRQLGALRSASQRVAEGDFTSRIPVQGRDELAQTASAFNAMAARLQDASAQRERAEAALRVLNEQLEERVRTRTEELAELNRQLRHRALHDGLTGLPNRCLFHDRLQTQLAAAERSEQRFAVALLDLNRFKQINDEEGHAVGDRVLQAIARRLSAVLRDGDTVARLGGDEFALILRAVVDEDGARTAGDRLLAALSAPLHVAERDLLPGGSVGVALYPEHGHEAETLLRHADAAMYHAKFAGSGFALYRPPPPPALRPDDEEQALRRALGEGQLTLRYQPRVNMRTQRLCGFEALVRWRHPTRGLLRPEAFLPSVERYGLAPALTDAVLGMALRQCADWRRQGTPLTVSINLAPQDVQDVNLPMRLAQLLDDLNVSPSWLELEVPASALSRASGGVIDTLETLDALGVRVLLDDVRALEAVQWRALRVAGVKFARAMIHDVLERGPGGLDALRALVQEAHQAGLVTVALGVERVQEWEPLRAVGCHAAQGYYVGPPAPAEEALLRLAVGAASSSASRA